MNRIDVKTTCFSAGRFIITVPIYMSSVSSYPVNKTRTSSDKGDDGDGDDDDGDEIFQQ